MWSDYACCISKMFLERGIAGAEDGTNARMFPKNSPVLLQRIPSFEPVQNLSSEKSMIHLSRLSPRILALGLLVSTAGTVVAQPKLAPGEVNGVGPERLMPVPKIGPNDAPRQCVSSDGSSPRYLPETKISMQDVNALRRWGVVHFKIPGDCSDWDFVVSKWQETIGSPVTGVLTPTDEAKIAQMVKAHRSQVLPFDPNR